MATIFIKDFCLLNFDTDAAVKIKGIWRHVKGYYDMDAFNGGMNASLTCHFENGCIKATYPDFVIFIVEPAEENINQIICEYNMDELSNEEYNRKRQEVQTTMETDGRRATAAVIEEIVRTQQRRWRGF